MFTFIKILFIILIIALRVGFFTLLERKTLSYIQLRKGPNKAGFIGLPQPLSDAAKLFTKETILVAFSLKPAFLGSPIVAVIIIFLLWNLYISICGISIFKLGILFFISVTRINVYAILFSGWASNSKYTLLGATRAVAQTISYEVRLAFILITTLILSITFNLQHLSQTQTIWYLIIIPLIAIIWFTRCLAETNRAPFDLSEGESELVSGFNTEYGGVEFALLFIAEYGRILFISIITICLFISGLRKNNLTTILKLLTISFLFLWVRGAYPRIRYDQLIALTWKTFLTTTIPLCLVLISQW